MQQPYTGMDNSSGEKQFICCPGLPTDQESILDTEVSSGTDESFILDVEEPDDNNTKDEDEDNAEDLEQKPPLR